eukprot:15021509-Alexandrium_andersonii.AAC.1
MEPPRACRATSDSARARQENAPERVRARSGGAGAPAGAQGNIGKAPQRIRRTLWGASERL